MENGKVAQVVVTHRDQYRISYLINVDFLGLVKPVEICIINLVCDQDLESYVNLLDYVFEAVKAISSVPKKKPATKQNNKENNKKNSKIEQG